MPRYFLHLRDGVDEVLDPSGIECATLEQLVARVLTEARQVIAADALEGEINLAQRIDADDGAGVVKHSLAFADAVTIRYPLAS